MYPYQSQWDPVLQIPCPEQTEFQMRFVEFGDLLPIAHHTAESMELCLQGNGRPPLGLYSRLNILPRWRYSDGICDTGKSITLRQLFYVLTLFTCKYLLICSFKDFPDSLMDDRTKKNILSYTVTYTALPI